MHREAYARILERLEPEDGRRRALPFKDLYEAVRPLGFSRAQASFLLSMMVHDGLLVPLDDVRRRVWLRTRVEPFDPVAPYQKLQRAIREYLMASGWRPVFAKTDVHDGIPQHAVTWYKDGLRTPGGLTQEQALITQQTTDETAHGNRLAIRSSRRRT